MRRGLNRDWTDGGSASGRPALGVAVVDLVQDLANASRHAPLRVVRAERREVADPPAVVSHARPLAERPVELAAGDLLAQLDRLEHRAVRLAPAADVVDRPGPRRPPERVERGDEVGRVDVVADLLAA